VGPRSCGPLEYTRESREKPRQAIQPMASKGARMTRMSLARLNGVGRLK